MGSSLIQFPKSLPGMLGSPSASPGPDGDEMSMAGDRPAFHTDEQSCAVCEYFDANGNNGIGSCSKGVPEMYGTDYSKTNPMESWCEEFEAGEQEEGEQPAYQADEPEGMEAA